MKRWVAFTVILLLVLSNTAFAEVKIRQYEQAKNTDRFQNYIYGVAVGFFTANALLRIKGQPSLYCQVGTPELDKDNYLAILDQKMKAMADQLNPDSEVEHLLFIGLLQKFPCNG